MLRTIRFSAASLACLLTLLVAAEGGANQTEKLLPFGAASPLVATAAEDSPDQIAGGEGLTPEMQALREKVRECLGHYYRHPKNAADQSPWAIMHAAIAYGVDTEVLVNGRRVNALGWLCWNGRCRGQQLLSTRRGRVRPRSGAGLEGHDGQFLAILAQSRVHPDYQLKVDGHEFTIHDLIEYEKATCRAGSELTFKLIALAHYLDSDETWQSDDGQAWSIPRLIEEEMAQSVVGAACGGTHRMMGFSYAVRTRQKRGQPFDGQWLRARKYVEAYHDYTFKLQNADGSLSTNWFEGRGDWGDAADRLETTGHTLEWLVYSLPDDQLADPRTVKAVEFLADLLLDGRDQRWPIGAEGHALHALATYDERAFGSRPGQRKEMLLAAAEGGSQFSRAAASSSGSSR